MQQKVGKALVIGAGIGGIRSALDLAEIGYRVILIDRAAHIGGVLAQLDHQFPSNHCGMCQMLPLVERDAGSQFCLRKGFFHENIEIMTSTALSALEGEPGSFTIRLRQTPSWVDPHLCVGCGVCETVCPVSIPDTFNEGVGERKAIYLPVPHAIPNPYVIDLSACNRCGACETVCPTQAIRLAGDRRKAFSILVVDDELTMRESLKEWLVNEGYTSVETAASGPEALEVLARTSCQLMLTDIKMPGMDGVELLQLAKESHPDLTVIMMTAYATVQSAVQAMKIGALDYFMKPFDPQAIIALVVRTYEQTVAARDMERTVHAIVVGTGTDFFDPSQGVNPYGYGQIPHVVTSLQFERILSGSGPGNSRLVRPADGKPIGKVAWMQCVGSRDIETQADFCSTVCCMYAIKQALLVKKQSSGGVDTAIYYMDMRTTGKSFQRYRDQAADQAGVQFHRARVHSIAPHPRSGDLLIRAVGLDGDIREESVDMVVLAVGQRPACGSEALAGIADLTMNSWGFLDSQPFFAARASRPGIFLSGSTSGLKEIAASVIQASAAALEAGRSIHAAGGSLAPADETVPIPEALLQASPKALIVVCTCGGRLETVTSRDRISAALTDDPAVSQVVFLPRLCTASGWDQMPQLMAESGANRLLIGACHPYLFIARLKQLAGQVNLPARLMESADLQLCGLPTETDPSVAETNQRTHQERILSALHTALVRLKHTDPETQPGMPVTQRALVVGGGIAGMQAALGIADMGFGVDLVEKTDNLGGNLNWLHQTVEGHTVAPLLAETIGAVERHPLIHQRLCTRVVDAFGQVGQFHTTLESSESNGDGTDRKPAPTAWHEIHGVVVIATGGTEAVPEHYGYGTHACIVTQKELEQQIGSAALDVQAMRSVVMIQCVGSREEPRNYCSRVCCPTALKHALYLKSANPEISVYVLYRDMMTTGFSETYFTQARRAGVLFIPYDTCNKPEVTSQGEDALTVRISDPVLQKTLEIEADLLVLAAGIDPRPDPELQQAFGIEYDKDGFFQEAESKWRPVDSIKAGIFACGMALGPPNLDEATASGQAAAQRALRILTRKTLPAGQFTASVRHGLCSLCRRCIDTCPYEARWIDEPEEQIRINPGMCQGCGACAVVCPNGAAVLGGWGKPQVLATIDAAFAQ